MKIYVFVLLAMILTSCKSGEHKQAVLELRKESNEAFKERNIENIAKYLTDDIAITTGNGTVIHGKDSLRNYLAVAFKDHKELYFVRETEAVKINTPKDRAWETGIWKGLKSESPEWTPIGGNYAAMWIKKGSSWKIRSELFVRLY